MNRIGERAARRDATSVVKMRQPAGTRDNQYFGTHHDHYNAGMPTPMTFSQNTFR